MNLNNLKSPNIKSGPAKAALGLTAAGTIALNMLIIPWEQTRLKPYLDIGNVPTACSGITGPEITQAYVDGYVFSKSECASLDARAVRTHEMALRAAINDRIEFEIPDFTMAAFISWTYNVGPNAAAKSTLVKLINAGDLRGACEQLPRWTRVQGVVVRGLENRRVNGDGQRVSEKSMCMIGLDAKYKTPVFEKVYFGYQGWIAEMTGQNA